MRLSSINARSDDTDRRGAPAGAFPSAPGSGLITAVVFPMLERDDRPQ